MKNIIIGSCIIGVMSSLFALETEDVAPNKKGFYIGVGAGSSSMSNDSTYNTKTYEGDSGTHIYAGYQFNNVVAIELAQTNYGDISNSQTKQVEFTPESTSLNVNVGYSMLNSQLRVSAILGLSSLKMNQKQQTFVDDAGVGLNYGAVIQYEPNFLHGLGVRLGYTGTLVDVEETVSSNYGYTTESYTQTTGMPYLALQYKF